LEEWNTGLLEEWEIPKKQKMRPDGFRLAESYTQHSIIPIFHR
jgi:hypothetical protein